MEIPKWTMAQMNLLDLGNTVQVAGVIYADSEVCYVCMLPKESLDGRVLRQLELGREDWDKIIKQTDEVQTKVLERSSDGELTKILVRKCTRTISQHVSWAVFRRDNFKCRYCGADDVPLTVDHLIRWEEMGPSTTGNLLSSCRRCNNTRGDISYERWIASPKYKKLASGLTPQVRQSNIDLIPTLDSIPRLVNRRKKR